MHWHRQYIEDDCRNLKQKEVKHKYKNSRNVTTIQSTLYNAYNVRKTVSLFRSKQASCILSFAIACYYAPKSTATVLKQRKYFCICNFDSLFSQKNCYTSIDHNVKHLCTITEALALKNAWKSRASVSNKSFGQFPILNSKRASKYSNCLNLSSSGSIVTKYDVSGRQSLIVSLNKNLLLYPINQAFHLQTTLMNLPGRLYKMPRDRTWKNSSSIYFI